MRHVLTLALVTLLAAPALAQPAARRPAVSAPAIDADGERAMLARVNALRAEAGVPALARHAGLDAAARTHSMDMAAHRELVHVSERTGDPNGRVEEAGVETLRIAQNISRHATTRGALDAILASPPHRAQLLDEGFTHIGLAAVSGADGVYVTQVLAEIAAPPPAPELPPPAVSQTPRPQPASPAAAVPPAPAGEADAVPPAPAQAQQGVEGQQPPLMRMPRTHRRVAGYWIQHGGRWWYFPVPAHVQPGQLLQPDLSVQGPPPASRTRAQPTAPPPPVAYPASPAPRTTPGQTIRWY
ncbi:MAG: CAP domain-containing protein [Myxococcales bacterium]|nr:CAP domain-containing protein [Myxococcales bacterium]